jgi:hypothetical protein
VLRPKLPPQSAREGDRARIDIAPTGRLYCRS